MKKIKFEKLTDSDLFGKFKGSEINSLSSSSLRGGDDSTYTARCSTFETYNDADHATEWETLSDEACKGY